MSFSNSYNQSFTLTNAKYLASKVAADLKRIQRFYGLPSDSRITEFETEITALLKDGYLEKVTYGFKLNGNWIEPSLIYTAQELAGMNSTDDDPGRIRAGADISGASFSSYLIYSSKWHSLSPEERNKVEELLPFQREGAPEPGVNGYIENDNNYSSGGKSINRSSVKKH